MAGPVGTLNWRRRRSISVNIREVLILTAEEADLQSTSDRCNAQDKHPGRDCGCAMSGVERWRANDGCERRNTVDAAHSRLFWQIEFYILVV